MNHQEIEEHALWIMHQYEQEGTRKMYSTLKKMDTDDFKSYRNSFFFWLVCLVSEKKEVRSSIISKINEIRNEQAARIKEALEHEADLIAGLPENDL